jgi:hypothetical protein
VTSVVVIYGVNLTVRVILEWQSWAVAGVKADIFQRWKVGGGGVFARCKA